MGHILAKQSNTSTKASQIIVILLKINKPESCALAKHFLDKLHHFDFDNVQVLAFENNCHKRTVLQIPFIKKDMESIIITKVTSKNCHTFIIT